MTPEQMSQIFEAVKVIPLRPQDFIVFKTNRKLGPEQAAIFHAYLEQETGHTRILIVDGGADVEVLRFEEPPAAFVLEPEEAPAHRPIADAAPPSHPNHRPIS